LVIEAEPTNGDNELVLGAECGEALFIAKGFDYDNRGENPNSKGRS